MGFTFFYLYGHNLLIYSDIRCCSPIVLNFITIMMTNEFVKYDAPVVELIEVEVEKGFAVSGDETDGGGTAGGFGG